MSEWWTYRPADFLMFAPGTYWRLFELHNQALWPAQVLAVLVGLAIVAGLCRGQAGALRGAALALALGWAFVAWTFLWQRYAAINWAAIGVAWGFGVQAIGLLVLSTRPSLLMAAEPRRRLAGLGLVLWSLLAHPVLAPALGRPWAQAEVFGLAPDPTAIATLGVLLCADAATRATRVLLGALRAGALAWCAMSAATLGTMGSAQGWVMLAAMVVAILAPGFTRARV
ncbi:DUF6064 family protein [Hydrogenophaga sp.]|uniref:DUF6064 family protein n=1 Tax=Hydrogenophaga sp. TaxID=1904254 RepID=UPI0028B44D58